MLTVGWGLQELWQAAAAAAASAASSSAAVAPALTLRTEDGLPRDTMKPRAVVSLPGRLSFINYTLAV